MQRACSQALWVLVIYSQINSQPEASNSQASTQATTATSTTPAAPIYSTPKLAPTVVQGGSASGYKKGWNPATRYGMPPDFFTPQSSAQFNASDSQPMAPQFEPSATVGVLPSGSTRGIPRRVVMSRDSPGSERDGTRNMRI